MNRRTAPTALLLFVLAGTAQAQQPAPLVTMRIDDGVAHHRSEMALRVSPSTLDIVAVWQEHTGTSGTKIYYNVSTDGVSFPTTSSSSRPTPAAVPLPPVACWGYRLGADPSVAFMQDGTAWISFIGKSPTFYDRVWVAQKTAQATFAAAASPSVVPEGDVVDKDVIAAGPIPSGSGESARVFFVKEPLTSSNAVLPYTINSPPQFDLCTTSVPPVIDPMWNVNTDYRAPNGAVIRRTTSHDWRIVVAQYYHTDPNDPVNSPTRVGSAYSDDGVAWNYSIPLDPTKATKVDNSGFDTIGWSQPWDLPTWSGGARPASYFNNPEIAVDPNDQNTMYMVFTGNASSEVSTNTDLFIAKSTDGGVHFSHDPGVNEPLGTRVVRLTDHDLGDDRADHPEGAVQFHPSIAVDNWGAVHVMYYRGWLVDGQWQYKVKIAHIPSISFTSHPTGITTVEVTSYPFTLNDTTSDPWAGLGGRRWIGDYMNSLDVRGCQLIGGYIAPPPPDPEDPVQVGTGSVGVWVAFNLIPNSICVPDAGCYANCDGSSVSPILNANDFMCFLQRYANGESYANCDGSTVDPVLNANDFQCFLNKYSAGCT